MGENTTIDTPIDDVETFLAEGEEKSTPEVTDEGLKSLLEEEDKKAEKPSEEKKEEAPLETPIEVELSEEEKELQAKEQKDLEEAEKELDKLFDEEETIEEALPGIPRVSEINKKFPGFFKEYPDLRSLFFEGKQYREVFQSVEHAKQSLEKAKLTDMVGETLIRRADSRYLFNGLKQAGALTRVADNLLDHLQEVDKEAHMRVGAKVIKNVIGHMLAEANSQGIEEGKPGRDLAIAARILTRFLGGEDEINRLTAKIEEKPKEESPRLKELEERTMTMEVNAFTANRNNLSERLAKRIENYTLSRVDPKKALTKGYRDYVVDKAFKQLSAELERDVTHQIRINKLWRVAHQNGYRTEDLSAIQNAYLTRVRSSLPAIHQKLRAELSDSLKEPEQKAPESSPKRIPANATPPKAVGKFKEEDVDWKRTSTLAYLNDEPVLKKRK